MTELSDIAALGFGAPYLGQWFLADGDTSKTVTLSAPDADGLGCGFSVENVTELRWLPPTLGTLSYTISGPDAPLAVRALRDVTGESLFSEPGFALGHFIIERRVQSRLAHLMDAMGETGPRPASLTLALPQTDAQTLANMARPTGQTATPEALGLTGSEMVRDFKVPHRLLDTKRINATVERALTELKRVFEQIDPAAAPEARVPDSAQTLLSLPDTHVGTARLHAHDAQGLAVDAGSVAALFSRLLAQHPELAPPALVLSGEAKICDVAPWRGLHFCGLGGGPLPANATADVVVHQPNPDGSDSVLQSPVAAVVGALPEDVDIMLTPSAEPLQLALAPEGRFKGPTNSAVSTPVLTLWDAGDPPERAQARIFVVDHEALLTGHKRSATPKGKQDFPSARVPVAAGRAAFGVTGLAAGAGLAACLARGPASLATPWLEPSVGGSAPAPGRQSLDDLPPGFDLHGLREGLTLTAAHLRGTGQQEPDGTITNAAALLTLKVTPDPDSLPAALPVRPLLHVLDRKSGRLVRRFCAPARLREDADAPGTWQAHLLIDALPSLRQGADAAIIGVDLLFPTAQGPRTLADLRVARPDFVDEAAARVTVAGDVILAVQSGRSGPNLTAQSGETLVLLRADAPVLFLPEAQAGYDGSTVGGLLNATHEIALIPHDGASEPDVDLAVFGAGVETLFFRGTGAVGRHRGTLAAGSEVAALSAAPGASALMQASPPADPFDHDAGARVAGVFSAQVEGPVVQPLIESLRAIRIPGSLELVAQTPAPPAPIALADDLSDSAQIAILRTVGRGGEGLPFAGLLPKLDTLSAIEAVETWLDAQEDAAEADGNEDLRDAIRDLRVAVDGQAHKARALHRRFLSFSGLTEMRDAVLGAIARAEHHIVIVTEALDQHPEAGEAFLAALASRLAARPALQVILAAGDHGADTQYQTFDPDDADVDLEDWLAQLSQNAPGRVHGIKARAPGRAQVRQYGTLVVIDSLSLWFWAGGLSRWGLHRNGSVGLGVLGDVLTSGSSPLVRETALAALGWHLGLSMPDMPQSIEDLAGLLALRR